MINPNLEKEIAELLRGLIPTIDDDFRASDDPSDKNPGISVTISTTDGESFNYQTGDNSYSGACYGDPYWSVLSLYRGSDCDELAADAINELIDAMAA